MWIVRDHQHFVDDLNIKIVPDQSSSIIILSDGSEIIKYYCLQIISTVGINYRSSSQWWLLRNQFSECCVEIINSVRLFKDGQSSGNYLRDHQFSIGLEIISSMMTIYRPGHQFSEHWSSWCWLLEVIRSEDYQIKDCFRDHLFSEDYSEAINLVWIILRSAVSKNCSDHYGNQSRGYLIGGRRLWPHAVPRLAARSSQSNPRGSGPEVLKREHGHVTAETGVVEVGVFRALQPNVTNLARIL